MYVWVDQAFLRIEKSATSFLFPPFLFFIYMKNCLRLHSELFHDRTCSLSPSFSCWSKVKNSVFRRKFWFSYVFDLMRNDANPVYKSKLRWSWVKQGFSRSATRILYEWTYFYLQNLQQPSNRITHNCYLKPSASSAIPPIVETISIPHSNKLFRIFSQDFDLRKEW